MCITFLPVYIWPSWWSKPPPPIPHLSRHVLPALKGNCDTFFFSFFFAGTGRPFVPPHVCWSRWAGGWIRKKKKLKKVGKKIYLLLKKKKKSKRSEEPCARIPRRRRPVRRALSELSSRQEQLRGCRMCLNKRRQVPSLFWSDKWGRSERWEPLSLTGKREIRVKTARRGELRRGMITNTHTHRQEKLGMKYQSCWVCRNEGRMGPLTNLLHVEPGRQKPDANTKPNPDSQSWPIRAPHWCLKCLVTAGMGMGSGSTIWCDTIQYDSIRYNAKWFNTIQYDMIQYGTKRYETTRFDTIRQQKIWYQTKWNDTIWNDAIQYLLIQYNAKWYDTTGYNTKWCKTIPYYEN